MANDPTTSRIRFGSERRGEVSDMGASWRSAGVAAATEAKRY